MIDYYKGDPKRIQHFLKVHAYAKLIGEQEGLDKKTLDILEVAALTHDIGIKISEEKYNSSAGKYQEIEGPTIAQKMFQIFVLLLLYHNIKQLVCMTKERQVCPDFLRMKLQMHI